MLTPEAPKPCLAWNAHLPVWGGFALLIVRHPGIRWLSRGGWKKKGKISFAYHEFQGSLIDLK